MSVLLLSILELNPGFSIKSPQDEPIYTFQIARSYYRGTTLSVDSPTNNPLGFTFDLFKPTVISKVETLINDELLFLSEYFKYLKSLYITVT